jgi:hypothetical protein
MRHFICRDKETNMKLDHIQNLNTEELDNLQGYKQRLKNNHSGMLTSSFSAELRHVQTQRIVQSLLLAASMQASVTARREDTQNTRLRYSLVLEKLGMTELAGVLRMSMLPPPYYVTQYEYWEFTRAREIRLRNLMHVATPPSVYQRCINAYRQGIPCAGLVLVEQHTVEPEIRIEMVVKERIIYIPRPQPYDPVLLWMLPFSDDLAIPFVAGVWYS